MRLSNRLSNGITQAKLSNSMSYSTSTLRVWVGIECSPGPAKGEIESSITLLLERSLASQPRRSKTFVRTEMEDKKSTPLCDGTPHGAAVSNFLGCSRHQQRLCRRPRCLAHLGKPQSMRADGGLRGEKEDTSMDMQIDRGKNEAR